MTSEDNKAIVRRFWQAFEADDHRTLDEVLATELVAHSSVSPQPLNRDMHLEGVKAFNTAFSDRQFTVDELIAEGDTVATRITMRGVHTGNLQDHQPTHKPMTITGLTIERLQDGQIVERWFNFNVAAVMQQLGLAPQAS